jgi:hypothetical protein
LLSTSASLSIFALLISPRRQPTALLSVNTMRAAVKKTTAKAPAKATAATSKTHAATHPSWVDMIKVSEMLHILLLALYTPFLTTAVPQECILAHPDDARAGVSRPTIKKVGARSLSPLIFLIGLLVR